MPGSASGIRRPLAGSPQPAPFPPLSPQPCPGRCSRASQVLWSCPTSRIRSSAPYALRASCRGLQDHFADERGISRFPNITFPCVLGVSDHGELSRASRLTARLIWPSTGLGRCQRSQGGLFEIPYPARRFPCQRFDLALRFRRMTRGRVVRYSFLVGDSHPSTPCRSSRRTKTDPSDLTVTRKVERRKPRISSATRKMYQQQGRYIAALRPLSKEARAKIKAIREKSGVQTAIAAAKRMAK
jgi:hypothetical protein